MSIVSAAASRAETVLSAVIDNNRMVHGHDGQAIARLLDLAMSPGHVTLLYAWDRPCVDERMDGGLGDYPGHQLRVSTADGWAAINYVDITSGAWDSLNPASPVAPVEVLFDPGVPTWFRRSAVLPCDVVREALREFVAHQGVRPEVVRWQDAAYI